MLLDSHLVERFHALHRQKKSGNLVAEGEGFRIGICLADGDPVAVDIGRDLETAFADSSREYHKLDDNSLAELRAAVAGGAKARDYLIQRQLISEAEADQVGQAVVEDILCRSFRGPATAIRFDEGVTADALAIGSTALRMRIGVESLIRTCDQRVSEQIGVEREIGSWDSVFALSEGEHSSGQLSEYEKMVLNFIDGHSSVEQIAELCRDSSLNLARVLRSLAAKRVIHRLQLASSGVRQAITPGPQAALAGSASAASPLAGMTPYRAPRESGGRAVFKIGLFLLLAIVLGVAVLVYRYGSQQSQLTEQREAVAALVNRSQWREALETIDRLAMAAGNDWSQIRVVDELRDVVKARIEAERIAIGKLIQAEDFAAARRRIALLPEDGGLAARLREEEDGLREEAEALAGEVRTRLQGGDVAGALAAIDSTTERRAAKATEILAVWRRENAVVAGAAGQSLQQRLTAVARLRQSRPDAALEARLNGFDAELHAKVAELSKRIQQLEQQAASGAWKEVQDELAKLRLGDLGAGTETEVVAVRAANVARLAMTEIQATVDAALATLGSGASSEMLEEARTKLRTMLQTYPTASGRDAIDRIAAALATCAAGGTTTAERAAEATALAAQVPAGDTALAEALTARAEALLETETAARTSLEEARRMGRIGDWSGAVAALEALVRQPTYRSTAVRLEAEQELDAARAKAARRAQLRVELREALRRGDAAGCETIAREIGLAYLPLVVASSPAGAEVVAADGTVVGSTPVVLDVTADERVDLELVVRRPGYVPVTIRGAQAEGGWRISVRLDRAPQFQLALGHPLTSRPSVAGGSLWLADRGRVVRLAAPGAKPASVAVDTAAGLSEPVFAPVTQVGKELLLATRERIALRVDAQLARVALPAGTDLPLTGYRSALIADRDLLIVAALDGRLYAAERGSRLLWQGQPGAAFAAAPILREDRLLCVRSDGRLEIVRAEDGKPDGAGSLDEPVLAVWPEAGGFAGLTAGQAWAWDGVTVRSAALPEPCIGGGPGVAFCQTGRVLLHGPAGWSEAGRLDPRPQAGRITAALAWNGHAVVVHGRNLAVLGAVPFSLDGGSDLLVPTVWDRLLVVASLEGRVWAFAP